MSRDAHIAGDVATVAAILRRRADRQPDRLGYGFLSGGARNEARLSYAELDRRARAIAVRLRRAGAADGQRAVLLFPPGLDFVAAFFGCLYAGTVAVPAYPPDPFRLERTLPRLAAIVGDAAPAVALTTTQVLGFAGELPARAPQLAALHWIAVDELPDESAGDWAAPAAGSADVALLQYTSGSTGSPKGVLVSHTNLLHNLRLIREFFRTTSDSRGLVWLPPYHDMGLIGGLLQPLYGGFPVWLMSPLDFLADPLSWLTAMDRLGATISGGPNFAYDLCVRKTTPEQRASLDLRSWRVAFNGAEPIRRATMDRFADAFAPAGFRAEAFLPCYGLAEATLIVSAGSPASTAGDVDHEALERGEIVPDSTPARPVVSCGRGAAGQRLAIVDPMTLERRPADRVGEVWVSGPSVAQGYWSRPEEGREVFGARIAGTGEGPFLRTGDLGFLRDGELVITGRLKDLIIIRGRNHYPQDIELTAESAHPALRPGCTAAFLVELDGAEHLALVHEVAKGAEDIDVDAVARQIRQVVAEAHDLRVGAVVLLPAGAMPKTSSGKVRRRTCKAQLLAGDLPEVGRTVVTPDQATADDVVLTRAAVLAAPPRQRRTLLEYYVRNRTALACDVAATELVPDRPLVAAGLDSLAAQELGQAVGADLGVSVPLAEILAGATLSDVAERIGERIQAGGAAVAIPTVPADPREAPLTYGQRSLWFLHQVAPRSTAYTTVAALRLSGRLHRTALRRAFDALVSRHEMLRTTFATRDGEPVQVVDDRPAHDGYAEYDATGETEATLAARMEDDAHTPFDLVAGPLVRLHLYRRADDEHLMLLTAHHIVTDFWSMRILSRELTALYSEHAGGPPAALAAPAATYRDLVAWQESVLRGAAGKDLERYWDEQLRGGIPPLRLPGRNVGVPSSRGGSRCFRLDRTLTTRLKDRAAAEGVTLYMVLLTSFQALLHRITGQGDLAVGTPLAARGRREFAPVVGYCMNPVVIRSHAAGASSFRELLHRTRAQVAGAVENQDYPATLLAQRHAAAQYQAMFVFNQPTVADAGQPVTAMLGFPGIRRPFGPLVAESVALARRECAHDLELSMAEIDDELHGTLLFRFDSFDTAAADRLVSRLATLLDVVATDPARRLGSLLRAEADERVRVLERWNATDRDFGTDACVTRLFERQAQRRPDAVAVLCGDRRLSYRELNQQANQLAHFLHEAGVVPGRRVGLCLERSPLLIVALLAVLKAGGAYVPVDPVNPRERIAAMFADAAVDVIVSQQSLTGKLPDGDARVILIDAERSSIARRPVADPAPAATAASCAYVVYTSGSTGTPKGVEVRHGGLANYIRFFAAHCGIGPGDRVLQFSSAGFDAAAEEIYSALTSGAELVLRTDHMLADPARFFDACAALGVTVLGLATAFWHDLMVGIKRGSAAVPPSVRLVVIGGEKALPEHVATWHDRVGPKVRLLNTYGPTEGTVVAVCCDLTSADPAGEVPIGAPVVNVRTYLLDADLQPVPVGVVGELYLGGAGVAQGYLNRPGLTAERFVADPFGPAGGRLYRTGDQARHLPDGRLVFVGRADRQVKLSGHRVEPAEIETALRRLPGIADAVVVPHGPHRRLAAYLIASGDEPPVPHEVRGSLRASLPEYMVPVWYTTLAAFPRTVNGKRDLAALPAPGPATGEAVPAEPPRTPDERALARIWAEVLGVPRIRRHDDFFALGGHSLLAMRVIARVGDTLGRELPLRAVFEAPTLAELTARLADAPASNSGAIPRVPRDEPLPLSFAQEQVWFLEQFEPGSTNYNVPRALRVHGPLDPEIVSLVFADLEARHEILRTTFPDIDGVPVQEIHEGHGIRVHLLDRSDLPGDQRDEFVHGLIVSLGREPFDLAGGPLLRVTLLRLARDEHVLIVVEHHLVHDGWAQGVFLRDFLELYEARTTGRSARLPELPIQYADFAAWQRRSLQGERLRSLLDYWLTKLADPPRLLRLPTDRPRPKVLTSRGDQETFPIDPDLARLLGGFGRDHAASLFMTMFAAFSALMYGYSGQQDVIIGTGVANRQRPELENLLGMVINTVVLRADLSGDPSFLTLLDRTRQTCLEAYAHQDMPVGKLVERLRPARDLSHMPLFQVMFSFLDTPMPALRVPSLSFEVLEAHNRSAKFDLNIVVIVPDSFRGHDAEAQPSGTSAQSVTVLAEYNAGLFDASTIREMFGRYQKLLHAAVTEPGRAIEDHLRELGLDPAPLVVPEPGRARR